MTWSIAVAARAPRVACLLLVVLWPAHARAQGSVTVGEGDLGPGLARALWGHYSQTGGKFGLEDADAAALASGSAAHAAACVPGCAALPYLGAQAAAGCAAPEAFLFRYWRGELFAGMQKLWLDPDDVTGLSCGPCTGGEADVVECQMRRTPCDVEAGMDGGIPGTGYSPASYHEALRGILAEGLTPNVSLRSPFRDPGDGPCRIQGLTCTTPSCLADLQALVRGLYEYVRRNSGGGPCGPSCDFPSDALDRIVWSLVSEPDLGTGMGFFGPWGHAAYGEQLDALLAVPYPPGFRRRVAAPDVTSHLAVDDPSGQRASWLGVVRNKVDYVTYHGLYCGPSRNLDTNLILPGVLRAELGTAQPLLCTELANNENLPRQGPCGGNGCSGGTPPDCGANRLVAGMLDQSKALLYQTRSNAGLAGSLHLGLFEGHGVGCGGETGAGLVGTTTREIDAAHAGKEMYVQNLSITGYAFRAILRELGWNGAAGSVVLPTSSEGGLVEAARRFPDGSIALVIVNDGAARSRVPVRTEGLSFLSFPLRVVARTVAPAHLDAQGLPAPLLDVVTLDEVRTATIELDLPELSVTSLRIGQAGIAFVPRILALDPAALPSCGGTLHVTGEGIAQGDAATIGGARAVVGACEGSEPGARRCELAVPPRRLPDGLDRESVSLRVVRTASGAPSEPVPLTYLDPPEACGVETAAPSIQRGAALALRGRDLGGVSRAAITLGGSCGGCGAGRGEADLAALPLCATRADAAACGGAEGPADRAAFMLPSAIPPGVTSLSISLERDDAVTGVTVRGGCLLVPLAPGEPAATFCVEAPGAPCRIPAVAAPGAELRFRAAGSPPAGARFTWSFGDGTSAVTTEPVASHRYTAALRGGMDVMLRIDASGIGCPGAQEIGDALFLGNPAPPRIVAGPGARSANPPRLRGVVVTASGAELALLDVRPYAAATSAGIRTASGDLGIPGLSGQATASLLTGPGPGATLAPHVRAFQWEEGGIPIASVSFFSYGTLRHGVGPAAGAIEPEGPDAIVTAPGPGAVFGPHVRAFRRQGNAIVPIDGVSFWAYGTLKYGANVAIADLDDDGVDDLVTGPGPGAAFVANVRGFRYGAGPLAGPWPSFVAHAGRFGARVGAATRPGADAILAAPGPGPTLAPTLRSFTPPYGAPETTRSATAFALSYGATVAGADLDGDGSGEAIAGEGPDPAASSRLRGFDDTLAPLAGIDAEPFASLALPGGCEVAGSDGTR